MTLHYAFDGTGNATQNFWRSAENMAVTMHVADVDGVRIDGLLFDAGTANSNALLAVGTVESA